MQRARTCTSENKNLAAAQTHPTPHRAARRFRARHCVENAMHIPYHTYTHTTRARVSLQHARRRFRRSTTSRKTASSQTAPRATTSTPRDMRHATRDTKHATRDTPARHSLKRQKCAKNFAAFGRHLALDRERVDLVAVLWVTNEHRRQQRSTMIIVQ